MKNLIQALKSRFSPLEQLMLIGLFVRLFSVFFSKGFGWHDDHFLIIEAAQSWVDGNDYNNWLPSADAPDRQPSGHSLFYTGIHFFFFKLLTALHITDPQIKMYFVRFVHALWSLLLIKYAYKIAEIYGGKRAAWYSGLFMALFWFMPFMAVRNLAEFVCVPLLLMGIYQVSSEKPNNKQFLYAGLLLGMAFSIRFQTLFITAGIGLAFLLQKRSLKHIFLFALSYLFSVTLIQGGIDFFVWHRPFAEFMGYVDYNLHNSDQYGHNIWHMYFDLILGLLIPPLSIVLFWGYFATWKKMPLIFWSVLIYLAFHTYFPNKQERFVMTVLPLIIVSGTVGMFMIWDRYKEKVNLKAFKFSKTFVISINLILLATLSVSYGKRHRVEAMYYLNKHTNQAEFIVDDSNNWNFLMPPVYYFGRWISVKGITQSEPVYNVVKSYEIEKERPKPEYIVFWEAKNLETRLDSVRKYFPNMEYVATIEPSFIDKTLFFLNPENSSETVQIYKLQ